MKTYRQWLDRFLANDLCDFTLTDEGVQWLKLRSIERRELLAAFVAQTKIDVDLKSTERMQTIWQSIVADASVSRSLDAFLMACQLQENGRIDSKFEKIRSDWNRLVQDVKDHSQELVRWLYENQGDMRFGAENRIFLVLADKDDERASWKLKRNADKLGPSIQKWISSFRRTDVASLETEFSYRGRMFRTFADVIFVFT